MNWAIKHQRVKCSQCFWTLMWYITASVQLQSVNLNILLNQCIYLHVLYSYIHRGMYGSPLALYTGIYLSTFMSASCMFSQVCVLQKYVLLLLSCIHAFLYLCIISCVCLCIRTAIHSRRRQSALRTWSFSNWRERAGRTRRRRSIRNRFSGRSQTTSGALSLAR